MSKNKNRKGFFLELYKIMKSIKVFNKLNKQRCPNKLSLQRCCQKIDYMQRKCQTMKNILMVWFKHDILKNVVSKKNTGTKGLQLYCLIIQNIQR